MLLFGAQHGSAVCYVHRLPSCNVEAIGASEALGPLLHTQPAACCQPLGCHRPLLHAAVLKLSYSGVPVQRPASVFCSAQPLPRQLLVSALCHQVAFSKACFTSATKRPEMEKSLAAFSLHNAHHCKDHRMIQIPVFLQDVTQALFLVDSKSHGRCFSFWRILLQNFHFSTWENFCLSVLCYDQSQPKINSEESRELCLCFVLQRQHCILHLADVTPGKGQG